MHRHAHIPGGLFTRRRTALGIATVAMLAAAGTVLAVVPNANAALGFEVQSLDGSGNNVAHPTWGKVGTIYPRLAPARYADGRSTPVDGPNVRTVSNRVFQDLGQNIFSEHRVTQWGWTWGQFLDHTFGLVQGGDEAANIPFNANDPLEKFTDTLGFIPFTRSAPAPGTGVTGPRQQINTVNSYISGWPVYGGTNSRLEWLRNGPDDGNMANNAATLMLPGGYLPRKDARGDPASAPDMATDGQLLAHPDKAAVAGDVRANENIGLTATHTLFAREHNRIVGLLPNTLTQEEKFQIARRIVIAEEQYVTYNEFLPAMGVNLPAYTGYRSNVNASLSDEFATVGYRAHSQIHGEFEAETDRARYSQAQLDTLHSLGAQIEPVPGEPDQIKVAIPLDAAFFNPDLVPAVQLGPLLHAIGDESQYNNDEQIDDTLRSLLFQVPVSGNPDCFDDPSLPNCFKGVTDLGAIDVQRGRDHGMPTYNQLRQALGLPAKTSFTAITGESTEAFPPGLDGNNPASLDFTRLTDINGNNVPLPDTANSTATKGVRKTTTAARLKAVYGSVDNVDAFAGMVAEKHIAGTEFGELQLAMWAKQFQALRDGDRFFYGNDPGLSMILQKYGIDYHNTLAQIIARNTDVPLSDMNDNVFLVKDDDLPAGATCAVSYHVDSTWTGQQQVSLKITNLSPDATDGWRLQWLFPGGQTFRQLWNGNASQSGAQATVNNASWNAVIPGNGGSLTDVGFIGTWDNTTNPSPPNFTLNGKRCERG
jgi:peroxidase